MSAQPRYKYCQNHVLQMSLSVHWNQHSYPHAALASIKLHGWLLFLTIKSPEGPLLSMSKLATAARSAAVPWKVVLFSKRRMSLTRSPSSGPIHGAICSQADSVG